MRFRAECSLAGKIYGRPFSVDVAFGDPILGEPEIIMAEDSLAFAGIAPPALRVYPVESHIAEKLHAYTVPRSRPNTRIKDLPDLASFRGSKEPFTAPHAHNTCLPRIETVYDAKRRVYQLAQIRLVELRHDPTHLGMGAQRFDARHDLLDEPLTDLGHTPFRIPTLERLQVRDGGLREPDGDLGH